MRWIRNALQVGFVGAAVVAVGCTEVPAGPTEGESTIVVRSILSTLTDAQIVELFFAQPASEVNIIHEQGIRGATVVVTSAAGSHVFQEVDTGKYLANFDVIPGIRYSLSAELVDGRTVSGSTRVPSPAAVITPNGGLEISRTVSPNVTFSWHPSESAVAYSVYVVGIADSLQSDGGFRGYFTDTTAFVPVSLDCRLYCEGLSVAVVSLQSDFLHYVGFVVPGSEQADSISLAGAAGIFSAVSAEPIPLVLK